MGPIRALLKFFTVSGKWPHLGGQTKLNPSRDKLIREGPQELLQPGRVEPFGLHVLHLL